MKIRPAITYHCICFNFFPERSDSKKQQKTPKQKQETKTPKPTVVSKLVRVKRIFIHIDSASS